jgi:hypothetical protein
MSTSAKILVEVEDDHGLLGRREAAQRVPGLVDLRDLGERLPLSSQLVLLRAPAPMGVGGTVDDSPLQVGQVAVDGVPSGVGLGEHRLHDVLGLCLATHQQEGKPQQLDPVLREHFVDCGEVGLRHLSHTTRSSQTSKTWQVFRQRLCFIT